MSSAEIEILKVLDEDGGYLVRDISRKAAFDYSRNNNHSRSRAIMSYLASMQKEGLVRPLDDYLPRCWCRTKAGTDLVNNVS